VRGATTELAGPARLFLDRARVAVTSGHAFGRGGAGFVRINYATNAAVLDEALRRMAAAVAELRSPGRRA
jgi:cystathionine beta-lyase